MRLNCLTGLVSGIAGIAKKWLVTCMFLILCLLCLVCLHALYLVLGQRQHPMSGSLCFTLAALDRLVIRLLSIYELLTDCLLTCYPCW